MISTRLAVLATAMIIGVVGMSVAASPLVAEATTINTTRSNIKGAAIIQQDGDVACTNQALGQGGQQAVSNTEQNAVTGDGDPVPDIDVKMGKNPGGAGAGAGISSEGDPIVEAEQSIESPLTLDQAIDQNIESGDDFSTNEAA
jgi:hypothetical protein